MHASVMHYVAGLVKKYGLAEADVLEVGSYNVNGSVRPMFHGSYVGVDMRPGPGVDIVAPAAHLPFDDRDFDLVVSTEMLEHDATPWLSVAEMRRVLKPGGFCIVTARGFDDRGCFPPHDYPSDFYRYSVGGMIELLYSAGFVNVWCKPDPEAPGVFGMAQR